MKQLKITKITKITLCASLLGNLLADKRVARAGDGDIRAGKRIIQAGEGCCFILSLILKHKYFIKNKTKNIKINSFK